MSILGSAKNTLMNVLSPSKYPKLLQDGSENMLSPVKKLFSTNPIKEPGAFGRAMGSTALQTVLPGMMVANAVMPDRMDLDTAGPFEDMATRGTDLATALMYASSSMWGGKSTVGNILGEILGIQALHYAGPKAGRAVDRFTKNDVSEVQMQDSFRERLQAREAELVAANPEADPMDIRRKAVSDILDAASGYLDLFNR